MLATSDDYLLQENFLQTSPQLKAIQPRLEPSPEPSFLPPVASISSDEETTPTTARQSRRGRKKKKKVGAQASLGDAVLIHQLGGGNHPDLALIAGERPLELAPSTAGTTDDEMEVMDRRAPGIPLMQMAADASKLADGHDVLGRDASGQLVNRLQQLNRGRSPHRLTSNPKELHITTKQRTPLSTEHIPPAVPSESRKRKNSSQHRSRSHSRLAPRDADAIDTSLNLRHFAIPVSQGSPLETLPAMQKSPLATSNLPNAQQSLPSIHDQLAGIAHSSSFTPTNVSGPNHSPPRSSAPTYSVLQPRSAGTAGTTGSFPPTNLAAAEPSPATTHNSTTSPREQYRVPYDSTSMSPPSAHGFRATSFHPGASGPAPREVKHEVEMPRSGGSSQPSTSGLSAETWPGSERMGPADSERPTLPTPGHSGTMFGGAFRCEHPGCTAQPFGTQYLLNSHANVHSNDRPHYCSVKSCPRSEGGKGFKRKNEMIRHGLVHQSPGYICPFCPEREHKYPRPDNLQRHVRAHHPDKGKDDDQLRGVLAQRSEGGSRGRRRRVGS